MALIPALITALALVVVAVAAGLILKARSGRRRSARADVVAPAEVGVEALGSVATIVQFSTEFCARCPGVKRVLSRLPESVEGLVYTDVDLTHRTDLARRFSVMQTPTVLVIGADGVPTARFSGAVTRASILTEIDRVQGHEHVAA